VQNKKVLKKLLHAASPNDNALIVQFGANKGVNFMQFKHGVTPMKCHSPNGAGAFDTCVV
jgi:hypothetical protein